MAAQAFPEEFIRLLPKTDLHLHLDGSMRISTLIELAKEVGTELPAYTEAELKQLVFKEKYESLEDYLVGFKYTSSVLLTRAALERVAYEVACDNYDEGVLYFETRFAPQLHASPAVDMEGVMVSINAGLKRAQDEYNARSDVVSGSIPRREYGMIVCAMRFFTPEFSPYFAHFVEVHKYESNERLYCLASMALVTAAITCRDRLKLPLVGLDIAGAEMGFPADQHCDAYRLAHKHFLNKTVHAGEGYGPESIFQAITDLHADRIGHGFHLFDSTMVRATKIADAELYVRKLIQYVAEHRITLEVCMSSNLQTLPALEGNMENHSISQMLANRISFVICTDNRLFSHTTVTKEMLLAIDTLQLTPKQLKEIVINGFKRSFFPDTYSNKRAYVRSVINYYESLEKKFGLDSENVADSESIYRA